LLVAINGERGLCATLLAASNKSIVDRDESCHYLRWRMIDKDFQFQVERYATRHRLSATQLSDRAWAYLSCCRTRQEFQSTVEQFAKQYALSPTTFGLWAMNDSRFLFDLRSGRSCVQATVEKVCLFMAAHTVKADIRREKTLTELVAS
jgi:hypothetical protein